MKNRNAVVMVALAYAFGSGSIAAETDAIRFAKQTSMGYVQFNILEHRKLLEKHARALGLGDVKVSWVTFNGPDAMNTALLAGDVDVVAGGVPALITLWAKTRDTPQEVRGISALSSQPFLLNTRNPNVKTIRDFTDSSRIAVPAVGVSVQAVTLRMAAAQAFGKENYAKLDRLTISLPPPDATIGLLSGGSAFDSVFSVPPFQSQQLQDPAIHTVLNSYEVLGGPATFNVVWTTSKFRNENPKLYEAFVKALDDATAQINNDKRAAAEAYLRISKDKDSVADILAMLDDPNIVFTTTPQNVMKYVDFMYRVGAIKTKPDSWKALFFPNAQALPGS
jgi:NitT/TauT family transport system substrate-binding protein